MCEYLPLRLPKLLTLNVTGFKAADMHTTGRHFHHHTIAVHVTNDSVR